MFINKVYITINKIWSSLLFFDLVEIREKKRMTGMKEDHERKC